MIPFTLRRPTEVADALALASGFDAVRWLAGGTTLVDLLKLHVEAPAVVIDINRLPLSEVAADGSGVRIGALARMADVARHPLVLQRAPLVAETLLAGASPQLRNMATIGGNLVQRTRCAYFRDVTWAACNKRAPGSGCAALTGPSPGHAVLGTSERCIATHPSDLSVALVALGATVNTARAAGTGRIDVDAFYVPYGDDPARENVLERDELITSVDIPAGGERTGSAYVKARGRASFEFALASAAAVLDLQEGEIRRARAVLGGLAGKPWRSHEAEAALVGRAPTEAVFRAAANAALRQARPRRDTEYKVELGRRTLIRALALATSRVPA